MSLKPLSCAAVVAAITVLSPGAARAETTLCTPITTLPAVISTQGVFCLTQDLATGIASGAAITITTNNVTLDCNDRKLGGLAAGDGTQAYGISAVDRSNITIRGCSIRGFHHGVALQGGESAGGGHRVENNRFDGNTFTAVLVIGDASVVRNNVITDTGGGAPSDTTWTMGVNAFGNVEVTDNLIQGMSPTQGRDDAYGIMVTGSQNGSVTGNRITNSAAVQPIGIRSYGSILVRIAENYISHGGWAIYCDNAGDGWTQDNQLHSGAVHLCTNASNNLVVAP